LKVVIVIPTYNEKGNIERLISSLEEDIFPKIKNHSMHILVADDNSPDGTAKEVKKLMRKWGNIHLNTGGKRGLGAAYVRGMSYAIKNLSADILFEIDADGQHDQRKIPQFLKKIEESYDMVIGTRYSGGGSIPPNWPLYRKAFSIIANQLIRIVFGRFNIHDWTGGFRALKQEVFIAEKNKLTEFRGYTFQVSFLHKACVDGFRIAEVPFHFTDRTLGDSKIAPTEYIANVLKYVLTARAIELVHSPFLKYAITGFVGYIINAVTLEVLYRKGLHPSLGGAIGAELSIIWNFTINNLWSFNRHKITSPLKLILKFPQFNLVAGGSLLIISSVIGFGTHFFGVATRHLFLILAIVFFVVPYSYSMYNIFIWKRWHVSFLSKFQKMVG